MVKLPTRCPVTKRTSAMPVRATMVFFPMDESTHLTMGWGPERVVDEAEIMCGI
jgi:hypothetical protein